MHLATRRPVSFALCPFRATRWEALETVKSSKKSSSYREKTKVAGRLRRKSSSLTALPDRNPKISARGQKFFPPFRNLFAVENLEKSPLSILVPRLWTAVANQIRNNIAELADLGVKSEQDLTKWTEVFELELKQGCAEIARPSTVNNDPQSLSSRLRKAYIAHGVKGLRATLKHSFMRTVVNEHFSKEIIESQKRVTDLRYPLEWYPRTRALQRKIHLHVGPTNSGKTYQALKKLEAAESGIYAGPLRLLAHEVYTRLSAKGKPCALITGEERRIPPGQSVPLISCTVEMVPIHEVVDVAVIDEIQMLGDDDRGWAWTRAFLGVQAGEVHLCGEMRTIPLIQSLCAAVGDTLEIHKYERLSPLKVMKNSLKGDLKSLQKGDAVILFSRLGIHTMKNEIESATKKRCAVVYGSLPPETRAQQASLFNDPNNDYDYLVASDAIGMGLNLAIKRIIFETTTKWNGTEFLIVSNSDIKQIAGRAGRYRVAAVALQNSSTPQLKNTETAQNSDQSLSGLVTTLEDVDLPIVKRAMADETTPLTCAFIMPPTDVMIRFASFFPPRTPFSYILTRLYDICSVLPQFRISGVSDRLQIADCIQHLDLTIEDRITMIAAPASFRVLGIEGVTRALAKCIADRSSGDILDVKELDLELLDKPPQLGNTDYLQSLEALHQAVTLYLWLSYRFLNVFKSQALAFHIKGLVEEKIDQCLANVRFNLTRRQKLIELRKRQAASATEILGHRELNVPSLSRWEGALKPKISHELTSHEESRGPSIATLLE